MRSRRGEVYFTPKTGYVILLVLKITIYTCGQKQGIKIMQEDINKLKKLEARRDVNAGFSDVERPLLSIPTMAAREAIRKLLSSESFGKLTEELDAYARENYVESDSSKLIKELRAAEEALNALPEVEAINNILRPLERAKRIILK